MISQISGKLLGKELDRVEIMTTGGVAYELTIPLGVYESLPRTGDACALHTYLVVKEDGWQLFGFASAFERKVFQRVLDAKGVGPALAIGLMSALSAERLVRAIRERDIATLQGAPRVGRKKAEQLILDLAEKMDDLLPDTGRRISDAAGASPVAENAIRALVSLGYANPDAERAVKAAVDSGGTGLGVSDLIRESLRKIRSD
ncbi:MAG TPA: Holliday junction branch migration protein RuvA [Gemmatimonadaceae bacterium]|nr:Holliday junction branch migration protein RuvA [Gemmatimonadaceae bacterium]